MIRLGYSTSGLTQLDIFQAIHAIADVGYSSIELSLHKQQLNPFEITDKTLIAIRKELEKRKLFPACVAPATFFFQDDRPHDPSLLCLDLAGRKQRIQLIKEAIRIAKILEVPIVNFGSGFLRDEHIADRSINPEEILIDSIHRCLEYCPQDVTLTIEPEPGMYIETLQQATTLIQKIQSNQFQLHLDFCHAFCSEPNYLDAIKAASSYVKYLHVADTNEGYNLKIVPFHQEMCFNGSMLNSLIYFPETANFLFLDPLHVIYFFDEPLTRKQKNELEAFLSKMNIQNDINYVDYNKLFRGKSLYETEIYVYLISIPYMNFHIIERARPIINYLKTKKSNYTNDFIINKKVANTLIGKVHFHEIPGKGQIDFEACFNILEKSGFSGDAIVELYTYADKWQNPLQESFQYLSSKLFIKSQLGSTI